MNKEQTETSQEMSNRFHKERETAFNKAKENITFQLRGDNKYYYAFQCAKFEHNIIKYGYDTYANKSSVKKEGLLFNEYSITLGHYYGHDLKRFNDRKEMLGFVIGYNECIATLEYNTHLKKVS